MLPNIKQRAAEILERFQDEVVKTRQMLDSFPPIEQLQRSSEREVAENAERAMSQTLSCFAAAGEVLPLVQAMTAFVRESLAAHLLWAEAWGQPDLEREHFSTFAAQWDGAFRHLDTALFSLAAPEVNGYDN